MTKNTCSTCIYGKTKDNKYFSCLLGERLIRRNSNVFHTLADVMSVDVSCLTEGLVEGKENAHLTTEFAWPVKFKESLLDKCDLFIQRKEK